MTSQNISIFGSQSILLQKVISYFYHSFPDQFVGLIDYCENILGLDYEDDNEINNDYFDYENELENHFENGRWKRTAGFELLNSRNRRSIRSRPFDVPENYCELEMYHSPHFKGSSKKFRGTKKRFLRPERTLKSIRNFGRCCWTIHR